MRRVLKKLMISSWGGEEENNNMLVHDQIPFTALLEFEETLFQGKDEEDVQMENELIEAIKISLG